MSKKVDSGKVMWIIVLIVSITLIATLVLFNLHYSCGCSRFKSDFLGQFGDFYGGILGTLVTFASVYFIFQAYRTQQKELEISKKSVDLETLNRLYSELVAQIDTLEYRRIKYEMGRPTSETEMFKGSDALYNFDDYYMVNPNTVLNSLNGILVSFRHTILMIGKVRYKYSFMKEVMLTKVYFLYYSKIIWPVYSYIYDKHKDVLLNDKQPNAKHIFENYESLTKEAYKYLISKGHVDAPSEPKIRTIIGI